MRQGFRGMKLDVIEESADSGRSSSEIAVMEPAPREQNTHDQSKPYSRAKPDRERRLLGGLLRIPDEASGHAWRDTIRDD
jgi:hypothetical protein